MRLNSYVYKVIEQHDLHTVNDSRLEIITQMRCDSFGINTVLGGLCIQ